MSSSPPTDTAVHRPARWRSPAGWPLRTRIVAILIVLLTALGLVVGATAEIFLRDQLYGQLDNKLRTAMHPAPGGKEKRDNSPFGGGNDQNYLNYLHRPFIGSQGNSISIVYNATTRVVDPETGIVRNGPGGYAPAYSPLSD